jgi:hypothetical protein
MVGLAKFYWRQARRPLFRTPAGHARQVKVMASVKVRKFNRFETQH